MAASTRRRSADRTAVLLDAARLVATSASQNLDVTLDALAEHARVQLEADASIVHLAVPGSEDFIRRRPNPLAPPDSPLRRVGERFPRGPFIRAAFESGRAMFTSRFQADARFDEDARNALPSVDGLLVAPLQLEGRPVGLLVLHWVRPPRLSAHDLALAEALAHHAAAAIHTVELLDANRRGRLELEALLDAVDDSIVVWTPDGRLLRANRVARQRFLDRLGRVPASLDDLRTSSSPPSRPDGTPLVELLATRALRGEACSEATLHHHPDGPRRFHAHAAPLTDPDGRAWGAVVVSRDVTELHATIARSSQLDGAIKTARRVAHELNNALTCLTGYGELLPRLLPVGEAGEMAEEMGRSASDAAEIVDRLQRIVRFEETGGAGPPMLDLEAAQPYSNGVIRPSS